MLGFDKIRTVRIPIPMIHVTPLIHRIALARFSRNRCHIKTIAKQNLLPLAILNTTLNPMVSRTIPTAIVLQSTIHIVRFLIVYIYMVKLPHRNVLCISPSFTPIVRNIQPPIVAVDDVFGIVGMHIKRMMIRMNVTPIGQNIPMLSAVFTSGNLTPNAVYTVLVARVYVQFSIIKRSVPRVGFGAHFEPISTAIIAAIHRRFCRFHKRIYSIGR